MTVARFRFYEELNEFIAPQRRKREFEYRCARAATVKNAIEAIGVPHTEVELIIANGESVDFSYRVREGDCISVYPQFEAFDIRPLLRVRPEPMREPRFIADAHLGGLARLLRMLGLDTLYRSGITDVEIRRIAAEEHRIVLTRDRDLLVCSEVTHGCYVHTLRPEAQLREIVERLQLQGWAQPLTRCLQCNLTLEPIEKAAVVDRLPPSVAERQTNFCECRGCSRIYWAGDHYRRMNEMLRGLVPGLAEAGATRVASRNR